MAEFARFLLREGEGLLSRAAWERMSTVHGRAGPTEAYGYGLLIRELDGRRYIGHGGGMVGYSASLQVDADAGMGVVVLQNGWGVYAMALARSLMGSRAAPRPARRSPRRAARSTRPTSPARSTLLLRATCRPARRDGGGARQYRARRLERRARAPLQPRRSATPRLGRRRVPGAGRLVRQVRARAHRSDDGGLELWHGADRYVRAGSTPQPTSGAPARVTRDRGPLPFAQSVDDEFPHHPPWRPGVARIRVRARWLRRRAASSPPRRTAPSVSRTTLATPSTSASTPRSADAPCERGSRDGPTTGSAESRRCPSRRRSRVRVLSLSTSPRPQRPPTEEAR